MPLPSHLTCLLKLVKYLYLEIQLASLKTFCIIVRESPNPPPPNNKAIPKLNAWRLSKYLSLTSPPKARVKSCPLGINHVLSREEYFRDVKAEMETIIFCDYPWGWSERKKESLWIADNFLWWPTPRKFWYCSCTVTKGLFPRRVASKNSTSGGHES